MNEQLYMAAEQTAGLTAGEAAGWGTSFFVGGIAAALLIGARILNKDVKKAKWCAWVGDRTKPWLILFATAGCVAVLINWVLSAFGLTLNGLFHSLIVWLVSRGSMPVTPAVWLDLIGVTLGIVCACYLWNLLWDTLRPKGKVNKNTSLGAFVVGIAPALFVAGGIVGAVMHSIGTGGGTFLSTIGSMFGGSV